jgi:hypothetical protein
MASKKSMHAQAVECANSLGANTWWYHPDLVEAFKAGWRASTKARWPKAKITKRRRAHPNG